MLWYRMRGRTENRQCGFGGLAMKSYAACLGKLAVMLVTAVVFSSQVASQQDAKKQHPRYRLVDVATFGGPNSVYNVFTNIANEEGVVVGAANTPTPDPFPACFDSETCFEQHAWEWRNGRLSDLGVLPRGGSSFTNAINERGLVVGQSQDGKIDSFSGNPSFVATVWDHGKIRNLGTFGGGFSIAIAATDQGFVMGAAENGAIDRSGFAHFGFSQVAEVHAFGWSGGALFDLGTLGGRGAFPTTMNKFAQVVGFSATSPIPGEFGIPPTEPFLWSNGRMRGLGSLGGAFGDANAINNQGEVVGSSSLGEHPFACFTGESGCHPFLWKNGKMHDLGTLGGSFGSAEWLNDSGEVIGLSTTANDEALHAFLWKKGRLTDIGVVKGDNSSNAFGINNEGQVVGQSWFFDGNTITVSHAYLWEGGHMLDLNSLVSNATNLNLFEADFITDRGWIIARGTIPNGDTRTAILIPDCDERVGRIDFGGISSNTGTPAPRAHGGPGSFGGPGSLRVKVWIRRYREHRQESPH